MCRGRDMHAQNLSSPHICSGRIARDVSRVQLIDGPFGIEENHRFSLER